MKIFTLKTALSLCSFSWISASAAQGDQTVEVQPGGEVTLLCSNFSSTRTQIMWFRVVKGSQPRPISSMFDPLTPAKVSDPFQNGKFETKSDMSTIFLSIKKVNSSDSGLYFCGYYISRNPIMFDVTYLEVPGAFDGMKRLMSVILAALTVFLIIVVICLAVKIKTLQNAHVEEQDPQHTTNQDPDELNYAAVTFHPNRRRNPRPTSEKQVEPNAVYSAVHSN